MTVWDCVYLVGSVNTNIRKKFWCVSWVYLFVIVLNNVEALEWSEETKQSNELSVKIKRSHLEENVKW